MKKHRAFLVGLVACAVFVLLCNSLCPPGARAEDDQGGGISIVGIQHPGGRLGWAACSPSDLFQFHVGAIVPVLVENGTSRHVVTLELVRFVCPMQFDKLDECKRLLPGERLVIAGCDADTVIGYWETRVAR